MSRVGQGSQVLASRLANSRLSHRGGLQLGGDRQSPMSDAEANGYIGGLAKQVSAMPRGGQVLLGSSARYQLEQQAEYAQAGFVPGAFYENRQGDESLTQQLTFGSADGRWNQLLINQVRDGTFLDSILGLVKGRAGLVAKNRDYRRDRPDDLLSASYVLVAKPDELKHAFGIDAGSLQDLGAKMMARLVTVANRPTRSRREQTTLHPLLHQYPDHPQAGPAMDLVNEDGITSASTWVVHNYNAQWTLWLASVPGFPEYVYMALASFQQNGEALTAEDFPRGWLELADRLAGQSPEAERPAFYRAVGALMYLQINQGYGF
jgi:hypothetical protein